MNANSPHPDAPYDDEQTPEHVALLEVLQRVKKVEHLYKCENQILRDDLAKLEEDLWIVKNELDVALEKLEALCLD